MSKKHRNKYFLKEVGNFKKEELKPTKTVQKDRNNLLVDVRKGRELRNVNTVDLSNERSAMFKDIHKGLDYWELNKTKTVDMSKYRSDLLSSIVKKKFDLKKTETVNKAKPKVSLFDVVMDQQMEIRDMKNAMRKMQLENSKTNKKLEILTNVLKSFMDRHVDYLSNISDLRGQLENAIEEILLPEEKVKISSDLLRDVLQFKRKELKNVDTLDKQDDRAELLRELRRGKDFWELRKIDTKDESTNRNELLRDLRRGKNYFDLKKVETVELSNERMGVLNDIRRGKGYWELNKVPTRELTKERFGIRGELKKKIGTLKKTETHDKLHDRMELLGSIRGKNKHNLNKTKTKERRVNFKKKIGDKIE